MEDASLWQEFFGINGGRFTGSFLVCSLGWLAAARPQHRDAAKRLALSAVRLLGA